MAGMYGVAESKKIAEQLAKVINTGYRIFKGNYFAGLELIGPINALRSVNLQDFKNEIGELDVWDRKVVELGFTDALDIADKALAEKLTQSVSLIEEAIELVDGSLKVIDSAREIVSKFRKLLGV